MPYKIIYQNNGYYVMNTKTNKRYSSYPLSYDIANKQLRALYRAINSEPKGGDLLDIPKQIYERSKLALTGYRLDYPPSSRKVLKEFNQCFIKAIYVFRKPVQAFVKPVLNAISIGQFGELLQH